MVVTDLDLLLHKYYIFYRYDVSNRYVTKILLIKHKFLTKCLALLQLIQIIRYSIFAFIANNGNIPLKYFDVIQYFGGISELEFICFAFFSAISLGNILLMNFGPNYEWFAIIRALSGFQLFSDIGLIDRLIVRIFCNIIKLFKRIFDQIMIYYILWGIIFTITVLIINMTLFEILIYGIITSIIYLVYMAIGFPIVSYTFLYYYIICYYFKLIFIEYFVKIGNILKQKLFLKRNTFLDAIKIHNNICRKIYKYNSFWCYYYSIICYTLIPVTLIAIELTLFTELIFIAYITTFFGCLLFLLSLFSLNLITASINSNAVKSGHILYKLLFQFRNTIKVREKLKVIEFYNNLQ